MQIKTIILDNGHGSDTPGKRSQKWADGAPQLFEWWFNRKLVYEIRKRLEYLGIEVHVLVPENEDIPLKERTRRANEIAIKSGIANTLLVSVHGNASEDHRGTGWEIWTSDGHTKADDYAEFFLDAARDFIGGRFPVRGEKDKNFWILKNTACPAVLTENLFYDNRKDYDYLMTEEGFLALVGLHVKAISDICNATAEV